MRHFFGYLAIFLLLSHVACSNFSDDPDGIVLSDSFDVIVSVDYGRDPGVEDFLPDSRPELSGDLVSDEFTSDPGNGDESPGDAEPDIDGIGEVAADISEVDSVGDANEDIRDTDTAIVTKTPMLPMTRASWMSIYPMIRPLTCPAVRSK